MKASTVPISAIAALNLPMPSLCRAGRRRCEECVCERRRVRARMRERISAVVGVKLGDLHQGDMGLAPRAGIVQVSSKQGLNSFLTHR